MRWVLPLAIAAAVLVSACGSGDNGAPTASPTTEASASPTATATASPTASLSPTPNANVIRRGPDIDFPDDMALIIETGCWGCDGPPTGLRRFWKDAAGNVQSDKLLSYGANSPTLVDVNGAAIATGRIQGLTATQDASVIAFGVCIQGSCGTGGLDSFEPSSLTAVYRSLDGGITWQEFGQLGPAVYVMGATADGRVFAWNVTENLGQPTYITMPDGTAHTPPPGGGRPVVTTDDILWATADGRLLRPDGRVFADLPYSPENDPYANPSARGTITDESKRSVLVHWYGADMFTSRNYLSPIEGSGTTPPILQVDELIYLAAWFPKDQRAVLSIAVSGGPPVPAFLDVDTGVYNLIREAFQDRDSQTGTGRTIVRAVQTGPFARVTGTGSCLNIRTDPSTSGTVLTCMADGVLLRESSDVSAGWVSVITPGGTQGWASLSYLER